MKKNNALLILTLIGAISCAATMARVSGFSNEEPREDDRKIELRPEGEMLARIAGRGNPWINFEDGRSQLSSLSGGARVDHNSARPLALASADFDKDGAEDIAAAYEAAGAGMILLQRGNLDSIYPNSPEARQRKAEGKLTAEAFLPEAETLSVNERADLIGAGDFNADGNSDIVMAASGKDWLRVWPGNGRGGFDTETVIQLPGEVTSLLVGDLNRADGLEDVAVGINSAGGPKLVVFESPEGMILSAPEMFDLTALPTALAAGHLDKDFMADIAVAAGSELMIIHGRDRKLSSDETTRATVALATVEKRNVGFAISALAVGDFAGDVKDDLALLGGDGAVRVMERDAKAARQGVKNWNMGDALSVITPTSNASDVSALRNQSSASTLLFAAKVSSLPKQDLIILDSAGRKFHIIANGAEAATEGEAQTLTKGQAFKVAASADVTDEPVAALALRLGSSPLKTIVVLKAGPSLSSTLAVIPSAPLNTYTVTNKNDSGAGSFRKAIQDANAHAGLDTIDFNIPGAAPHTIFNSALPNFTPLPVVTSPVIIDATTQPTFAGTPVVELAGPGGCGQGGNVEGLVVSAGNSTVRGLVINRQFNIALYIHTNGGNVIEGNYVGTNVAGTAALCNPHNIFVYNSPDNVIGGTTAAARNLTSGSSWSGIQIEGASSTGNQVLGNYVGTNAAGTAALGNFSSGVTVADGASNNVIGASNGRNLISGNSFGGVLTNVNGYFGYVDTSFNRIQSNIIGLNAAGTAALSNDLGIHLIGVNETVGGVAGVTGNTVSGNTSYGIIAERDGAVIAGNMIGTNAAGTTAIGNIGYGIQLSAYVPTTILLGGTTAGARNVISGNTESGVRVPASGDGDSTGVQIIGNYIGTDVTGNADLGNGLHGVFIENTGFVIVGASGAGNVISGNGRHGVYIQGISGINTVVANFIGTNAAGTAAIANSHTGVYIDTNSWRNIIGGTTAATRNVISGNAVDGVRVDGDRSNENKIQGNNIGVAANGATALPNGFNGVVITGGDNNIIGGTSSSELNVISGNTKNGIGIAGTATGNLIQGNYIGVNSGGAVLPNGESGVLITNGADDNVVGGTTFAAHNVISGNTSAGVEIDGSDVTGNIIQGNYIGTNTGATGAIANLYGVWMVNSASGNTIGGTAAGARNIISGNTTGVLIDAAASNNLVEGNYIGTRPDGTTALANGTGVNIVNGDNNTIGGTTAAAKNVIAFNNDDGVKIGGGARCPIRLNSIFSNTGLGIDLGPSGVTPNDAQDADTGANNLQNFPVLTSATNNGGGVVVTGTLNSTPNASFAIDFYSNTSCDSSGNGEGTTYAGSIAVTTNASGNATINQNIGVMPIGWFVTATATDTLNNTSEFSACSEVSPPSVFTFGAATYGVNESGPSITITVNRTNPASGAMTVNYATSNGTAAAPADYTSASGTLSFADNDGSETFNVAIANDTLTEDNETVNLTLSSPPAGGSIGAPGTATLTIVDNDTIVTSAADSGDGSLRQAITNANSIAGVNTISFNITPAGAKTINLASPLPAITTQMTIDGTTQPGFSGAPIIELNGTSAGAAADGLAITADSSVIKGLIINRFSGDGIALSGADNNTIAGCYIGTNTAGIADAGNTGNGVTITNSANNHIGGPALADRNVISGNGTATVLSHGIEITGSSSTGNRVQRNLIGVGANQTAQVGNAGHGVFVGPGASSNIIGRNSCAGGCGDGSDALDRGNTIAYNGSRGIYMTAGPRNGVLTNSIHSNTSLGIDLTPSGVTANNDDTTPSEQARPNHGRNFPVIASAASSGSSTIITGTLDSLPSTGFLVEFFDNDVCDATPAGDNSHGEGKTYVGSTTITTNASGDATFTVTLPVSVAVGHFITATSTGDLNTSEFSRCVAVCAYTLTAAPESQLFAARGGSGQVRVTASGSCGWTAASGVSWIIITSATSGAGTETITFEVRENTSASARTGTMTIAGLTFTVLQDRAGGSCAYSVSPASQTFAGSGGSGALTVTTAAGCAWNAKADVNWITITSASAGIGGGSLTYSVAANTGPTGRNGTIFIEGIRVNVKQSR